MANPRLAWKMVPRAALSAATAAAVLTALKTACQSGGDMFADGWTCEVDDPGTIQGIALKPPAAAVSELRIILAGKAASIGTPTMLTPDTATTGVVLCAISKGIAAETFGSFDDADPMGGGTFSGYWRGFTCASSSHITIFYSDEAVVVVIDNNANNTVRYIVAGAFMDPMSVIAGDAESSERLYGMAVVGSVATTGANNAWAVTTANSATANAWFVHGASDGNGHMGRFTPGAGTWEPCTKMATFSPTATTILITDNGKKVTLPWGTIRVSDSVFTGRLREIMVHSGGTHADVRYTGSPSVIAGYLAGPGVATETSNHVFFAARENS